MNMNMELFFKDFDDLINEKGSVEDATRFICDELEASELSNGSGHNELSANIVLFVRNMVGESNHIVAVWRNDLDPSCKRVFDMSIYELATLIPLNKKQCKSLGLYLFALKRIRIGRFA